MRSLVSVSIDWGGQCHGGLFFATLETTTTRSIYCLLKRTTCINTHQTLAQSTMASKRISKELQASRSLSLPGIPALGESPASRPGTGDFGRRAAWHAAIMALIWRCGPDGYPNWRSDAVFATSPHPRLDQSSRAVRGVALVVVFSALTSTLLVTVYTRVGQWASIGGSARELWQQLA